jgi:putative transposase
LRVMPADYYPKFEKDKFFHVYNHANGNNNLFYSYSNYSYFLRRFEFYMLDYVDLYAYVLMPNHFHLLIRIKGNDPEKVSLRFRLFFMSYSKSVNRELGLTGSLFRKNVKRKWIETDDYLRKVILYIHRNPVHHGFAEKPEQYLWSSFEKHLHLNKSNLQKDFVLSLFGDAENYRFCHKSPIDLEKEFNLEE